MGDSRNTITTAKKSWFESMRERRAAVQNEVDSLDLGQEDHVLAAKVRGLLSEKRALDNAIEDADKFFQD